MRVRPVVPVVFLAVLPAMLPAQQGGDCNIISSGTTTGQNQGTPQEVLTITNPVVQCAGGRNLSADLAVLSRASGQLNLTGNVQFQDTARSLTSNTAQYFSKQRILTASGNAVLVHQPTNSVIRGEQVEYFEAGAERPESLVRAMGGQPRAVLRPAGSGGSITPVAQPRPDSAAVAQRDTVTQARTDTVAQARTDTVAQARTDTVTPTRRAAVTPGVTSSADSTTLDAQQIEIFGEKRLRGTGNAVLLRDSLRAVAHVIEFDQDTRQLQLSGPRARVEVPRYELYGDSITAQLSEDDQIREVLTRHSAQLWSSQLDLTGPAARLFFENGEVARVVAMNWQPVAGAEPSGRPHVENAQFKLDADSLDVMAPQQLLTEAVAVGNAYGERLTPDSLKPLLPEAEPKVMQLIANDWMRGDTVRAFFADNPAAAQDTAAPKRIMERLIAVGQPAVSMYRVRNADRPEAKLSFNYLRGTAIEVRFRAGEVDEVITPDAVGVFLEPAAAARQADANRNGGNGRPRQP